MLFYQYECGRCSYRAVNGDARLENILPWRSYKEHITAFFGKERLEGTAKNASALCERIVAAKGLKEVVFFCGDHRLDELPETLRRHNISVQELIVYNTIQTPRYVEKDYDAIMFLVQVRFIVFFIEHFATKYCFIRDW